MIAVCCVPDASMDLSMKDTTSRSISPSSQEDAAIAAMQKLGSKITDALTIPAESSRAAVTG